MRKIEAMFEGGQVVMTNGVANKYTEEVIFKMLQRHFTCDFGDLEQEDIEANLSAIQNKDDRILSAYGDCYINTEWDRSYTTILLKSEY